VYQEPQSISNLHKPSRWYCRYGYERAVDRADAVRCANADADTPQAAAQAGLSEAEFVEQLERGIEVTDSERAAAALGNEQPARAD